MQYWGCLDEVASITWVDTASACLTECDLTPPGGERHPMHHCNLFHPELLMDWNRRLVKGEVRTYVHTYVRREPVDTYVR